MKGISRLMFVKLAICVLSSSCGRSNPIPCTDTCQNPGDTRCNGAILQVCSETDKRCTKWQDWLDCSYHDKACTESEGTASCSRTCSDACEAEGYTRCDGTVIQTCALGEKGCLVWVSGTDCSVYEEVCAMEEGQARCAVVCEDECTVQGSTSCNGTFILTCAVNYYGCFYWEYGRDCADDGLICDDTGGFATCGPCVPDCSGRQCGPDPVCGQTCGTCMGATEVCRLDTGMCEDVCAGKDCGTFEGIYCGECEGLTEVCHDDTGACEDVCQWRECGVVEGINCGTCPGEEICLNGQCFRPICSEGMCDVPAGTFWMGCNEEADSFCDSDEYPHHEVYLDAFNIDQFEVTQAQYYLCVLEGVCEMPLCCFDPESQGSRPVVGVPVGSVFAFCSWAGKRLCTEAEWEKAARGTDGRRYPWGNEPATCDYSVMDDGGYGCGTGTTMPVGSKPAGASPYGPLDMAGNAAELVADCYSSNYYSECELSCSNPINTTGCLQYGYVQRGGDYGGWASQLRTSRREKTLGAAHGFRCCR